MRKLEAAIAQCGLDAFAAFLDGVEVLHTRRAHVDFHLDEIGVEAVDGGALCFEEHGRGRRITPLAA
jgi:hypothetical protein